MVDECTQELQELSEIAKMEPHSAYKNFVFSMKQKWNHAMRTIPDLSQHLQPLENKIKTSFLPNLFSCQVNENLRDLIALPARMGGMGIINPVKVAGDEHRNSTRVTAPLTSLIKEQDGYGTVDPRAIKDIKKQISRDREKEQRQRLNEIQNSGHLDEIHTRKLEMSLEKGASNWLTTLPIKEEGFSMTKQEFHTALAIRYVLPVPRLPDRCSCGVKFTIDHAMICKKGGYICQRHNELRDLTYQMMREVCKNAEKEPLLQPLTGEKFQHATANTLDNARLDLSAQGFWTRGERAFFDIRVFDPVALSYMNQSLEASHGKQEEHKRLCYEERIINVEHGSFTPLIFTIAGGMSRGTQKFYDRLAEMLAESRGQTKSTVVAWMRCRLSFSLLRSAILCLRGTRRRNIASTEVRNTEIQSAVSAGQLNVDGW